MKILISMFAFFLCLGSVLAQPTTISYQGKLLDNAGLPVNLNNVAMTFAIYDSPSGGSQIWPSGLPASKTVNVNVGLYSVTLGTGVGSDELIDPSIFDGVSAYLEVSVSASILPRTPVSSVPSAMISNLLSTNGWASPGAIGSTTPNSGSFSALTIGTGTTTYTFPSSRGSNGQVLQSNASGVLDWATPNQGTVTNVTGTAPISSTGGATPAISISAATTSTAGSMSAADKTKLDGIATSANNYVHPTGDGNLHVPATGTTNSGKVLTAGATAGSLSWETPSGSSTVTTNATLTGNGSSGSPLAINLSNSNTWNANQTFAGTFLITANSRIAMTNSDNNARDIRLQEPSGTGSQYLGFRAPSVTNNGNYLLPATVGSVGQALTISNTNGVDSASLHWATPSGGIPVPSGAVANDLLSFDGTNWLAKNIVIQNTGSGQSINNMQPYLVVNYNIALEGVFPSRNGYDNYIGEICIYGFNFEVRGWAFCNGQILSIAQNTALFSLLGTTYGGNGQTTFALPDLRGRTPIHQGQGPGLSSRVMGESSGTETITISTGQLPVHSHTVIYQ